MTPTIAAENLKVGDLVSYTTHYHHNDILFQLTEPVVVHDNLRRTAWLTGIATDRVTGERVNLGPLVLRPDHSLTLIERSTDEHRLFG